MVKICKSRAAVEEKIHNQFQRSSSIQVGNIVRKYEKIRWGPNKSHLVTIKTPTNHSSSRQYIVFRYVENHVGIGYVFRSR